MSQTTLFAFTISHSTSQFSINLYGIGIESSIRRLQYSYKQQQSNLFLPITTIQSLIAFLIVVLLSLMGISQAAPPVIPQPFSYVESLQLQSYQFTTVYAGTPITTTPLVTVVLTYPDPFTYAGPTTSAISLCGLESQNNSYLAYNVQPNIGASITSTSFDITFYGSTVINFISFFFLMVNSTTNFYVVNVNAYADVNNTTVGIASSGPGDAVQSAPDTQPKPSGMSSSAIYRYFLQSFKVQCVGSTDCVVKVIDITVSGGIAFGYRFQTDEGNTLYEVNFNIFIYDPLPATAGTYAFGFYSGTFDAAINAAYADTGGQGFAAGFNGRCFMGLDYLKFSTTAFILKFDMSKPYGPITDPANYIATTPPTFTMFCFLEAFDCSTIDPYCIKCDTQSHNPPACSDCTDPYFVQGGLCSPCSTNLTGCIHCELNDTCLACNTPTYYFDSINHVCLNCVAYLTHCLNCSSILQCDMCVTGYGLNSPVSCLPCGVMITNCQTCINSTYCSTCLGGFFTSFSGTASTCLPCSTIPNCAYCDNATYCTICNTDFAVTSNHLSCVCAPGLYPVTGFCGCLGCISAYKFNGSSVVTCLACDTSVYFQLVSGTCQCQSGFYLSGTSCIEICGDGRLFGYACDDGNLVNGDGCSNKCTVQTNYHCINGNQTTPSTCLYNSPLNPTIKSLMKVLDSNAMQIKIEVNNFMAPLDLTNISAFANLTIGGMPFTNFDASFDSKSSVITFTVPYTSSIEGQSVVLNLGYDPAEFSLSTDTLKFSANGYNYALNYEEEPSGNEQQVQSMGYAVAALSLVVLVGSTPFHRIIGLETFQVTQLVFFSRYTVSQSNAGTFEALNSLKYIDLYNYFANYPNVQALTGSLVRLGFTKTFIFNVLIQLTLILICWILFAIFNRKFQWMKQVNLAQDNRAITILKKYKLLTYIFSNLVFNLTISTFFILIFSYLSCVQPQQEMTSYLPPEIMFLNVAIFAYATLYACYNIYYNFKDSRKYNEEEGCYYRYLTIFLVYYLMTSMITVSSGPLGKYVLAGVELIHLIVLIAYRPYFLGMQNVCIIINQTVVLSFSALLILNDLMNVLHPYRGYVMMGIESLLIITDGLAIVRIYVHAAYNQKAFDKTKADAEKAKLGPKEEFKLPEPEKNKKLSNTLQKSIFERQQEQREKDLTALQRIKNRLKSEFKQKVEEERGALMDRTGG